MGSWSVRPRAFAQRVLRSAPADPQVGDVDDLADTSAPVVALAARVGTIALVTGAPASEATAMMLRLGLSQAVSLHVDVTYTSVTVSHPGDRSTQPVTLMRTVPALDWDYARLAHLQDVVDRVCRGDLSVADADLELQRRGRTGLGYRRWVVAVATFAQGASVCALLGGGVLDAVVAGLATLTIHLLLGHVLPRRLPYFLAQVVAGAVPMALAIGVMYLRDHGLDELAHLRPSLVVASGMVTMLAGLGVVGAAQDALDGYHITASARVVELLMRTTGLVLGVLAVLWVAVRLGVPAYLAPAALNAAHPAVQVAAAGAFSFFFGIGARLGPGGAVLASVFGAAGWATYLAVSPATGGDYAVSAGVGAFVVAVLAWLVGAELRFPPIALVTLGVAPLMPGMFLYRGLFRMVTGLPAVEPGDGTAELLLLVATSGVALALGSSLGSMLGRQLVLPTERVARVAAQLSLRRGQSRR